MSAVVLLGIQALKASAQDQKPDAPVVAAPKVPSSILFDQTKPMAPVNFQHAAHIKNFACKDCHGGDKPLFPQKKEAAAIKMADIYAGKQCGACHDGKKVVNDKIVFAAKTNCMKCHKKQ
jgi:c(7)-type cytochrome triheme protein